jgi:hypothetical protein
MIVEELRSNSGRLEAKRSPLSFFTGWIVPDQIGIAQVTANPIISNYFVTTS